MARQEGGKLRGHPVRRLLKMFVQGFAQRLIVEQRFAKPLTGFGNALLNA